MPLVFHAWHERACAIPRHVVSIIGAVCTEYELCYREIIMIPYTVLFYSLILLKT